MRILTFSSENDAWSFRIIAIALYQDRREHNRVELRKIGVIQDLLESIGTTVADADVEQGYNKGDVVLEKFPAELVLEEDQFDVVKQAMDAMGWLAGASRKVTAAYDLLDAAKHVTAKELAERKGITLVDDGLNPV